MLKGRVFITGGTGTIGTAIINRAERENWPCEFTVYSRDESKQSKMKASYPKCQYRLGDIRDQDWMQIMMRGHDLVIHAAAYKQVPSAEVNSREAIETNVIGSRNVALAAVNSGVPKVIGISTDKAVSPINLYGATKMAMERLFQEACHWGKTDFVLARYGNVIGSNGSVVPFFKNQSKTLGYLTVTSFEMTRFWLSVDQAIDVVIYAVNYTCDGHIVIPMCPSMKVFDVALALSNGAYIKETCVRAGEKIHECLINLYESQKSLFVRRDGSDLDYTIVAPASYPDVDKDRHFEFTSDNNIDWLLPEQFLKLASES